MPGTPHRLRLRCVKCKEKMVAECTGDQDYAINLQSALHEGFAGCDGELLPDGLDNCILNGLLVKGCDKLIEVLGK